MSRHEASVKSQRAVLRRRPPTSVPSAIDGQATKREEQRAVLSQFGDMKPACVRGSHGEVVPSIKLNISFKPAAMIATAKQTARGIRGEIPDSAFRRTESATPRQPSNLISKEPISTIASLGGRFRLVLIFVWILKGSSHVESSSEARLDESSLFDVLSGNDPDSRIRIRPGSAVMIAPVSSSSPC